MSIKVYNSLTRRKEAFKPLKEGEVKMYVCGPTVYDLSHIGHARSAVAFDVVYRYLKFRGYRVRYVRNYTDIDDKIIDRAIKEGCSSGEIAERYIKAFDEDMAALDVLLPDIRPKATETVAEIIGLIETLIGKGYAYAVERSPGQGKKDYDVYFSVRKFSSYGTLSGKNIEELEAGARVSVDERKKDPLDFALWKVSRPGEPFWESPWGKGRPGWHIECSAMNRKYLGDTLDIHGGGKDLIFPHHENEIAQSEAATGKRFARYWLHNGFINIEKEKMSKSLGNILLIRDILKRYHPEVLRLFFLSSHYRTPIEYSERNLKDTEAAMERVYLAMGRMERMMAKSKGSASGIDETGLQGMEGEVYEKARNLTVNFISAMDDDFNTAIAIGYIFDLVRTVNRFMDERASTYPHVFDILKIVRDGIRGVGRVLGLFAIPAAKYAHEREERFLRHSSLSLKEINGLILRRNEARKRKDFDLADEIRSELGKKGIFLEDTPEGTIWRVRD